MHTALQAAALPVAIMALLLGLAVVLGWLHDVRTRRKQFFLVQRFDADTKAWVTIGSGEPFRTRESAERHMQWLLRQSMFYEFDPLRVINGRSGHWVTRDIPEGSPPEAYDGTPHAHDRT